jgi:pimeloyl-ACP methyl ester carboxylesterase
VKIRANGIMVNYELAGEGDCLALVHGAGDNLQMWYGQVPAFSERHRVLTCDVRGFGETELPESEVGVELLAADLRELLRALGIERAFVLGYSMGGRIALQLALDEPQMVRALVLASSGVGLGALMQASPPDLGRLSCPVLLIAGEHDAFMSLEAARAAHGAIEGSRLEVLPTGHAAALEAPLEFNRIVLDFLAAVNRGEQV